MKKLVTFITLILTLGMFGIVSAHNSENNCGQHDQSVSDTQTDCVYVCHKNNGGNWVVENVNKKDIGQGDFAYEGPTNKNGHPNKDAPHWCKDNVPSEETPPPTPPTPSPTPPVTPPTTPTPPPTAPVTPTFEGK